MIPKTSLKKIAGISAASGTMAISRNKSHKTVAAEGQPPTSYHYASKITNINSLLPFTLPASHLHNSNLNSGVTGPGKQPSHLSTSLQKSQNSPKFQSNPCLATIFDYLTS